MPTAITVISNIHDRQLAAAMKIQEVTLKAARKAGPLLSKAPALSERQTAALRKLKAPLPGAQDSGNELSKLLKKNAGEWAEFRRNFKSALIDAIAAEKAAVDADEKPVTTAEAKAPAKAGPQATATAKTAAPAPKVATT